MKLNIPKSSTASFTRKTRVHFNYRVGGVLIMSNGCVRELHVTLHSEEHIHPRVDYTYAIAECIEVTRTCPFHYMRHFSSQQFTVFICCPKSVKDSVCVYFLTFLGRVH
jgi:hypothetical protein